MSTLKIINGFLTPNPLEDWTDFEEVYITLREKEGRILREEEILRLPEVDKSNPLYKEWKIRKRSSRKLLNYIQKNPRFSDVLEVGCGNGWFTSLLADSAKGKVWGIDINRKELKQARKLFLKKQGNVRFLYGDIRSGFLAENKFDLIVFAASIQYFKSVKEIIHEALQHLTLQGEIHIIDSAFYSPKEINFAKMRSEKYFTDLGFPSMSRFYFHHGIQEIKSFNYSVLYDPHTWINRAFQKTPFYLIVIKNHYI
ncbi:MAG: class I SAM-dependent methyltransferase [Ginsengibacter sp.]